MSSVSQVICDSVICNSVNLLTFFVVLQVNLKADIGMDFSDLICFFHVC